jgi:hypothetical protein
VIRSVGGALKVARAVVQGLDEIANET